MRDDREKINRVANNNDLPENAVDTILQQPISRYPLKFAKGTIGGNAAGSTTYLTKEVKRLKTDGAKREATQMRKNMIDHDEEPQDPDCKMNAKMSMVGKPVIKTHGARKNILIDEVTDKQVCRTLASYTSQTDLKRVRILMNSLARANLEMSICIK